MDARFTMSRITMEVEDVEKRFGITCILIQQGHGQPSNVPPRSHRRHAVTTFPQAFVIQGASVLQKANQVPVTRTSAGPLQQDQKSCASLNFGWRFTPKHLRS